MIDSQNDLILKYYTERPDGGWSCHISRVGLDGTVKHSATLTENQNFLITMEEFESQPRQYYQWGTNGNGNLIFYVIDSAFHVENSYIIHKVLEDKWYGIRHIIMIRYIIMKFRYWRSPILAIPT
jgi:hypothetical protein